MEISFHTEELLSLCIDESIADQKFGIAAAETLRNRLDDIRAADTVHELLAGRPRAARLGDQDCYCLEIGDDTWLTIIPNHIKPRVDANDNTDWGRVRRVRVMDVGN